MKKTSIKSRLFNTTGLNQRGASLTEMGLLVGLVAVVAIASVNALGVKVACVFENTSAALAGRDFDPNCAERTIADIPDVPSSMNYALTFDDPDIEAHEASSVSLTATDLMPGDEIFLTVREGEGPEGSARPSSIRPSSVHPSSAEPAGAQPTTAKQFITRTATATAASHQFTGLDLTGYSRGPVYGEILITRNGKTEERPATAMAWLKLPIKLTAPTEVRNAGFGYDVAITSTHAFASAPYEDSAGAGNIGKVYAYDRETGDTLFSVNDIPQRDTQNFGMSLAASEQYLAVKADNSDGDHVHVYDMTGAYLFEVDNDAGVTNTHSFGRKMRIVGDTLLVGDFLANNGQGAIHAFDLANNGALKWSTVSPDQGGAGVDFDIEDDVIVANNRNSDFIEVYDLASGSFLRRWGQAGAANDHLEVIDGIVVNGTSADMTFARLSNNQFMGTGSAVGASGGRQAFEEAEDVLLINSGVQSAVSMFDPNTRKLLGRIEFPDRLGASLPAFGSSMEYQGGQVLIGAPSHESESGVRGTGAAYIIDMP